METLELDNSQCQALRANLEVLIIEEEEKGGRGSGPSTNRMLLANLRQRIKLLYRCPLVAEASGCLWLASSILSFASALGGHLEDLMRETSSLLDSVHTRLRSSSRSELPVSSTTSNHYLAFRDKNLRL